MSINKISSGFTLIELLVTLVILGLLLALVTPNVMTWLASRERSTEIKKLNAITQLLPLEAVGQGQDIVLSSASQLEGVDNIEITQPIEVLANGYCKGGLVDYADGRVSIRYQVVAPFCQVVRVND